MRYMSALQIPLLSTALRPLGSKSARVAAVVGGEEGLEGEEVVEAAAMVGEVRVEGGR